ncbi:MAG: LysR substrate-binding domain-containing protein [Xanthobacteraceae bacterium]
MNVRQLEIFRAVMRWGSISTAAENLQVSQPAVSKILKHFETQLGYALFDRVGGRLIATAEAKLLYANADRLFREFEVVRDLSVRIRERKVGLLRIGASGAPSFTVLPGAVLRFQSRHPEVKVIIHTLPARELGEMISVGELDLALSVSGIHLPNATMEVLKAAPVMVVMRHGYHLASKAEITAADLTGERLISFGSHTDVGLALDRAFERAGLARRVQTEISLSIAAIPLVQAGVGIALLDGLVKWAEFSGLVARPFAPTLLTSLSLVTNGGRPSARLVREFIADLRAEIGTESVPDT